MYLNFSESKKGERMSGTTVLRCHRREWGFRCSNMVEVPIGTDPRSVNCGCHGKQKSEKKATQPQAKPMKTTNMKKVHKDYFVQ